MGQTAPSRGSLTSGSIAALVGGELVGPGDVAITSIDAMDRAGPGAVTFIRSGAFAARWPACRASAVVVTRGIAVPESPRRAVIHVADADAAVVAILRALSPAPARPAGGVHPLAFVDSTARVDPSATIGPMCVVGAGAAVGARAWLMSSVTLGSGASVGGDSTAYPGVVIGDRCVIGSHTILQPGVKIGADGFGYTAGPEGAVKIPHIGNVVIGDHVEIGANTCIDRGKFGSTTIGDGTKIDNLVQIGHNCRVGRACLICGQCGLSGSVTLGDGVILAGSVGVADNLTIGDGARVGGRSGVNDDIPAGESWLGSPAQPLRDAAMNMAMYRDLARHIRELRRRVKAEAPGS